MTTREWPPDGPTTPIIVMTEAFTTLGGDGTVVLRMFDVAGDSRTVEVNPDAAVDMAILLLTYSRRAVS